MLVVRGAGGQYRGASDIVGFSCGVVMWPFYTSAAPAIPRERRPVGRRPPDNASPATCAQPLAPTGTRESMAKSGRRRSRVGEHLGHRNEGHARITARVGALVEVALHPLKVVVIRQIDAAHELHIVQGSDELPILRAYDQSHVSSSLLHFSHASARSAMALWAVPTSRGPRAREADSSFRESVTPRLQDRAATAW
jgi:hypothetical protein